MLLGKLTQPITSLPGVGAARGKKLESIGISTIGDALTHVPRGYEDRKNPTSIAVSYAEQKPACTVVEVVRHDYFGFGRKRTLKVAVQDNSATGWLVCFGRNFLEKMLKVGEKFYLYGEFTMKFGSLQCSLFEVEPYPESATSKSTTTQATETQPTAATKSQPAKPAKESHFGSILPIYPLTEGITQGQMRNIILPLLKEYGSAIDNELPQYLHKKYKIMNRSEAIQKIHRPASFADAEEARYSLVFTELLYFQILIQQRRAARKAQFVEKQPITRKMEAELTKTLPFTLTKDQESVLRDIREDLAAPYPMGRLVHGEVGSGKTLVAFISALYLIEQGFQVAFLAPTDLLAQQHAQEAYKLLQPLNVSVAQLTGNTKGTARKETLEAIKRGDAQLLIGTHALFSKDVAMKRLGLVIIDEQQRFGVMQRIALMEKGVAPNLLLLSATPIPRTLAMSIFGDLEVSSIKHLPKGRKPIVTHLVGESKRANLYGALEKEIQRGHQIYFVYPLIEESEALDLKDATAMYEHLRSEVFPHRKVALIHSRIPKEERDPLMDKFRRGKIDILVATSVIEIGVNVPNATCMVVEHAERFGLSSLHQLRGRIGRGAEQGYLFLMCPQRPTDTARERLIAMKELQDGFAIAEKDLEIRGPGEISGLRQSGFFRLTFADLVRDLDTLAVARDAARELLEEDSALLHPEHAIIQEVLTETPPFDSDMLGAF